VSKLLVLVDYPYPIILRLGGGQYRALSNRFHMCTTQPTTDKNGFLNSFLVEIPRSKFVFAKERVRFERQTFLTGKHLIYLVFTPIAISVEKESGLVVYLTSSLLCSSLRKQETQVKGL